MNSCEADPLAAVEGNCVSLKGFALSSTTVCTDSGSEHDPLVVSEGREEAATLKPTSLEVLTLDFVTFSYLEYWLLARNSLINIQSLRELRVAHFHDTSIVDKLLMAVGNSLEHFHLKPGSWSGTSNSIFINTCLKPNTLYDVL